MRMEEKKVCQNCGQNFSLEQDDLSFYEKVSVPAPSFCPACRFVRRMTNTNERVLYKRACDLTGKNIISMFPSGTPFPVYEVDAWYADGWDPHEYAMVGARVLPKPPKLSAAVELPLER